MAEFGRSPREAAARLIRDVVPRVAVDVFGAQVIESPIPGFTVLTDRQLDDPRAGIRAALLTRQVAQGQMYEYARAARAAGRSWDEIGEALDLPQAEFRSRAEDAFAWLVEGREPDPDDAGSLPSFRAPTTWWRCGSCDQQVTDHGPYGGSHPDDNEAGHAPDCARHRAAVAGWKARTGWHDEADEDPGGNGDDVGWDGERDEAEEER